MTAKVVHRPVVIAHIIERQTKNQAKKRKRDHFSDYIHKPAQLASKKAIQM
jgi:hypothetical protein